VAPRALVLPRQAFPGFENSTLHLKAVGAPLAWAHDVLEDTPDNQRVEVARLRKEHFSEGVRETLQTKRGEALSAAELLATHALAAREVSFKLSEEAEELAPAAVRFSVPAIPGAAGITESRSTGVRGPGLLPATILFTSGRCLLAVGSATVRSVPRATARAELVLAAERLLRRVQTRCRDGS
jgi:hypothetical protein